MAADLIDTLNRFQTLLLADEHVGGQKIIPKDAIESIVESFGNELSMRVFFVCNAFVGSMRYNLVKGGWEKETPILVYRRDAPELIGVKVLQDKKIALLYTECRLIVVDPEDPNKPIKLEFLGGSDPDDTHHLSTYYDERPELFAAVSIGPNKVAVFDNILKHNYLETDLSTGKIFTFEMGGQYESEDEDEGEEDLPENGGYRRFAHTYHDFYDIGFGRCLLVADAEDDMPRTYIVLDVRLGRLTTIPTPFPEQDAVYDDQYVGMSDGSIFAVGGTMHDGNRYVSSARCSKFDLSTGRWTRLADAPIPLDTSAIVLLPNGDIMVVTVWPTGDKMLIYHPPTDTWTMAESKFADMETGARLVVV